MEPVRKIAHLGLNKAAQITGRSVDHAEDRMKFVVELHDHTRAQLCRGDHAEFLLFHAWICAFGNHQFNNWVSVAGAQRSMAGLRIGANFAGRVVRCLPKTGGIRLDTLLLTVTIIDKLLIRL